MGVDPVLGRISNPQTLNRYAHVLANPVRNIDIDGRVCGAIQVDRFPKGPWGTEVGIHIGFESCEVLWVPMGRPVERGAGVNQASQRPAGWPNWDCDPLSSPCRNQFGVSSEHSGT